MRRDVSNDRACARISQSNSSNKILTERKASGVIDVGRTSDRITSAAFALMNEGAEIVATFKSIFVQRSCRGCCDIRTY